MKKADGDLVQRESRWSCATVGKPSVRKWSADWCRIWVFSAYGTVQSKHMLMSKEDSQVVFIKALIWTRRTRSGSATSPCFKYNNHFYYIWAVMDLYSRKIIGYEISKRNSTQLAKVMIRHAAESRTFSDNFIFHSDRGANYTAATQEYLCSLGILQSFSRPRNPHDNVVMGSFFGTLKRKELYRIKHRSEREFKAAVGTFIRFYNTKRPHRKLKSRTPDA